jgi:Transposase DDE domain
MRLAQNLTYSVLSILSTAKNSFENFGKMICKSGKTIARWLSHEEKVFNNLKKIALAAFLNKKKLFLIIDDSFIRKIHSLCIEGTGWFYDTKLHRSNPALRLILAILSDGKINIPIYDNFWLCSELIKASCIQNQTKEAFIKAAYQIVQDLFPAAEIIVLVDGLFATIELLHWASKENIMLEARMHSNRIVEYKGQKYSLKKLSQLKRVRLVNRMMQRTVEARWQNIDLQITISKRIDRHQEESIVFQVSTKKCEPRQHVALYKKRWPIEKAFRTTKQSLGLEECFSTDFQKQKNHVASVFQAYVLLQLEAKRLRLKSPEAAARHYKEKSAIKLINVFIDQYGHLLE